MMISVTYSFVLKRKEHYLDEEDMCVQQLIKVFSSTMSSLLFERRNQYGGIKVDFYSVN